MKKILLALSISAVALAQSTLAEDFVITTANAVTNFKSGEDDFNIIFKGAEAAGDAGRARLGQASISGGYSVHSMTFKAADAATGAKTPSFWNLLGNYTMNIPSASGEYTVLKNEGAQLISYQMGTFTIKNKEATSTATALIDLGASYLELKGGGGDSVTEQSPKLLIQTNTKISSTNTNIGLVLRNKSTLEIADSKKFTMDAILRSAIADSSIKAKVKLGNTSTLESTKEINLSSCNITLAANAVMKTSSDFTASASEIEIASGAKLTSSAKMALHGSTIKNDGTFGGLTTEIKNTTVTGTGHLIANSGAVNIDEESSVQVGSIATGSGQTITVKGSLSVNSATTFNNLIIEGTLSQTTGASTTFNRKADFKTGSTFSTTGDLIISTGTADTTGLAYTTVSIAADSESFTVKENVKMRGGTLLLDKANAIKTTNGGLASLLVENQDSAMGNARLDVNAANEFASISADTKSLEIYLSNDPTATLKASFSVENGAKIILEDFSDNMVYVSNYEDIVNLSEVFTAKNSSGQTIDTLYCYDGWLTSTAIPEPAEWAAIFGAIALGLAIYRRRK